MKPEKLRAKAFAMLARREHSRQEMQKKLIEKGADAADVIALLDELAEKNYQSDTRMSEVLLRESLRKGQGKRRLQHNLKQHRIHEDTLQDALSDIDWLYEAVRLRCRRFGDALPSTPKEKARQLRFLQYRGYEGDLCYRAIGMSVLDLDDDE